MVIDFYTYNLQKKSFAEAEYDGTGKTIDFYNSMGENVGSIDASDFVIDGMIDNVYLSGTDLYIIFNTDSGKQEIVIDLTSLTDDLIDRVDEIEEVTSIALNDLNDRILTSGDIATQIESYNYITSASLPDVSDFVTSADVKSQVEGYNYVTSGDVKSQVEEYNYVTSGDVATQISTATQNMVESTDVDTIWKGTQAAYDVIVSESAVSETTLYIIVD